MQGSVDETGNFTTFIYKEYVGDVDTQLWLQQNCIIPGFGWRKVVGGLTSESRISSYNDGYQSFPASR